MRRFSRLLLVPVFMAGGFFQFALPLLAQTAAGQPINNQATGTYEDPNNPGTPINTTSNTVTIQVAEVAGITVSPAGVTDVNGGSVSTGDSLQFDFLVTNTGNASTFIFVPGANNITVANGTIPNIPTNVQVIEVNGTAITPINVPAAGAATNTFGAAFPSNGVIPASGNFRVRITVTATTSTVGDTISVQFGNTNPPGPQNAQNISDLAAGSDGASNLDDVRTVDDDPGAADAPNPNLPVNGEREAAAFQQVPLAVAIRPLALATVLKARANYSPGPTNATTDDLLTYRLDLRVETTSPDPAFTPAPLVGTTIQLNGAAATRILVADAMPTGTVLDGSFTPVAPPGWQVVYSVDDPNTTDPINAGGPPAPTPTNWTTAAPPANTVRRIGFIFDGTLAPGSTTESNATGFQFRVVTANLPPTGGQVANLAQSFGQTEGDPNGRVIYDESGDNRPNNFNDDNTPIDPNGTSYTPGTDRGVPDPGITGTDNNNNNTGTGPRGEANVFPITPVGSLLNGPGGQPGATGPTNNQDDYVNRSTPVPPGLPPGSTFNPDPTPFNNTFQNPPSNAVALDNVRILPLPPDNASVPLASQQPAADIPADTLVTITVGAQTATYRYNGTVYNLDAGTPIVFNGVTPGTSIDYQVQIDLPANSPLSPDRYTARITAGDTPEQARLRAGFGVPVVVFVDNGDIAFNGTDDPIFNIKIDRLYTGYMRLLKQSQILDATGTNPVGGANGLLDANAKTPEPGQIIRYVLTYDNISFTTTSGAGNVNLEASNFTIDENGAVAPNNWAALTSHRLGTIASRGTVTFFNDATSLGSADVADGTVVTRYVNNAGTVSSGESGTFEFRRRVN